MYASETRCKHIFFYCYNQYIAVHPMDLDESMLCDIAFAGTARLKRPRQFAPNLRHFVMPGLDLIKVIYALTNTCVIYTMRYLVKCNKFDHQHLFKSPFQECFSQLGATHSIFSTLITIPIVFLFFFAVLTSHNSPPDQSGHSVAFAITKAIFISSPEVLAYPHTDRTALNHLCI